MDKRGGEGVAGTDRVRDFDGKAWMLMLRSGSDQQAAAAAARDANHAKFVFTTQPAAYLERIKGRKMGALAISVEEIEKLVKERSAARKARDFKRSDEIRDLLLTHGIELLDGPQGTIWKVK